MAKVWKENERKAIALLLSRAFFVQTKAILASFIGFGQKGPLRRRSALKYYHIPTALLLELSLSASNLECIFNWS